MQLIVLIVKQKEKVSVIQENVLLDMVFQQHLHALNVPQIVNPENVKLQINVPHAQLLIY